MILRRRRRAFVLVGLVAIAAVVAVAAWVSFLPRYRFWQLFETLGVNAQRYREYRHRQTGIVFVHIPAGRFWMGMSPEEEALMSSLVGKKVYQLFSPEHALRTELPEHEVELSAFLIGKYEVTRGEWSGIMGDDGRPSRLTSRHPKDGLSWIDCQEFCERAGLQLPTEAQWEYACRAGATETWGGAGRMDQIGWHLYADYKLHEVGEKLPNGFGLYDMHGNVKEWCQDFYDLDFYSKPEAAGRHPVCRVSRGFPIRVYRGGSYSSPPMHCRTTSRGGMTPDYDSLTWVGRVIRFDEIGFRPVFAPLP